MARQLTHEDFDLFVRDNFRAVIHFWAVWNGYDRKMRKQLKSLWDLFPSIAFAEFDIDPEAHHGIFRRHDVHGPPFLAFYRDGECIDTRVGLLHTVDIQALLLRL